MYEKSITRENRTAFVILIDQSGSMAEYIDYECRTISKAAAVAEVTNQILSELISRARRQEGVRDYYDIAVVGYSGEGVCSMLSEEGKFFFSVEELSKMEVTTDYVTKDKLLPDGELICHQSTIERWIMPKAVGKTPMFEALNVVYDEVKGWCSDPRNHNSFPPIIINITDGESSDGCSADIYNISQRIQKLSTADGGVLFLNAHIASSVASHSVIFPTTEQLKEYSHPKAQELSRASSVMPAIYDDMICEIKGVVGEHNFIGVSYNASIAELITILNIGTISVKRG